MGLQKLDVQQCSITVENSVDQKTLEKDVKKSLHLFYVEPQSAAISPFRKKKERLRVHYGSWCY